MRTLLCSAALFATLSCTPLPQGIETMQAPNGPDQSWHRGPEVAVAAAGPARFVRGFVEGIDERGIAKLVEFADDFVAAPASLGYDRVLDHLTDELRSIGFGAADPRLSIELIEAPARGPGWTPISGEVTLVDTRGRRVSLHRFSKETDVARVILPVQAPSAELVAPVARSLEDLSEGEILVTDVATRQVLTRAKTRGAVAIVSASLGSYNTDPTGADRHLDAIQFRSLPPNPGIAAFQISPRSLKRIDEELARGGNRPVMLELRASVQLEKRPLRTLAATIVGAERPDEAVVISVQASGPGAVNNASGVGGIIEAIRTLRARLKSGDLEWPDRSIVFLFGDEIRQTEDWFAQTELQPVAGISADMIGSRPDSGAKALLEREPDPGAWRMLPPDEPSSWGGGNREAGDWLPTGLSVIARCAMVDVGLVEGGWPCADHAWEGGSDHDVFINEGIPAVLFWHFTDFTYHTSLDRMSMVDLGEARRTSSAVLSAALAVASPRPGDLDRYLRSLDSEIGLRVNRADEARDQALADAWRAWAVGARRWLRNQCLGIEEGLPLAPAAASAPTSTDQ